MSVLDLSLRELHNQLEAGDLTAEDLVDASLKRISEVDEQVKAFLLVDEAGARKRARALDESFAKSRHREPLSGIPAGIKDNISTQGMTTTCASRMLAEYKPIFNATVMDKLDEAGAVTVGKVNMDEFAMGSTTESSYFQKTHNPWQLDRVPGGSSGGSAAAVAAREVVFSLGSDTGGSIRQPAAYCGVVGLKPSYGRVSRFGLIALASSLDQIGPITRTVEDAAYVLQAIAGHDPQDATSAQTDVHDYVSALTGNVKDVTIAVPKEMFGDGVDSRVKEKVYEALRVLEGIGARWEEVSLPHLKYAIHVYYVIVPGEASSNLARFDGIRFGFRAEGADNLQELYEKTRSEGFGREVKRRITFGTMVLSADYYEKYYVKAQKVRTLIRRDFERIFEAYDVILGPTAPNVARKIGETVDPLTSYASDMCTIPANLAGLPAISVPCGTVDGLPVGMQLMGKPFDEATVLRVAHAYEQQTDHHRQKPAL